jgi:hypothetical protein
MKPTNKKPTPKNVPSEISKGQMLPGRVPSEISQGQQIRNTAGINKAKTVNKIYNSY